MNLLCGLPARLFVEKQKTTRLQVTREGIFSAFHKPFSFISYNLMVIASLQIL
jgi:hypothetical protein